MNYRFNEDKMFMDISDGIAVVINSESGMYYGMNGFGTTVFDAIISGMDESDIETELNKMPGAPSDMKERLSKFIQSLSDFEIIASGNDNCEKKTFDATVATADKFILEVSAFDDAQEMLLADPIHEVKEQTGWTPEKESIGYSKEETIEREKKVK